MDDPSLPEAEHRAALRGLARLNAWSASDRALFAPIRQLSLELGRPVRLLDVACGGGDQLVRLARRARRAGIDLRPAGCDLSTVALDVSADRARRAGFEVRFFQRDVITEGIPRGYDVIVCSLFVHHLSDDDAAELFAAIEEASPRLALIQDLRRLKRGALLAAAASRLLTRSEVVRTDSLLSVGAAFELDEIEHMSQQAGMYTSRLRRVWPLRWQLEWRPRIRSGDTEELLLSPHPRDLPSPAIVRPRPVDANRGRGDAPDDDPATVAGRADLAQP
ncbi:methyltransferase domain-containing protein [Engelhardtia mirabilis]